jgi:hypothetical protein
MARLVAIVVFLLLQGSGAVIGFQCQGPVCDWMTGGHWVSPAVRVPLVAFGIVVAELLLLSAFAPCNRFAARLCGCQPYCPSESRGAGVAASAR